MLSEQNISSPILASYLLLPFNLKSINIYNPNIWIDFNIDDLKASTKLNTELCLLENPKMLTFLSELQKYIIEQEIITLLSNLKLFKRYYCNLSLMEKYNGLKTNLQLFDLQPTLLLLFNEVTQIVIDNMNKNSKVIENKILEYILSFDAHAFPDIKEIDIAFLTMLKHLIGTNNQLN